MLIDYRTDTHGLMSLQAPGDTLPRVGEHVHLFLEDGATVGTYTVVCVTRQWTVRFGAAREGAGGYVPTLPERATVVLRDERGPREAPAGEAPADADHVSLTLDLGTTFIAEAAAHESAACLVGAELSPLEILGCAVLRAAERQRASRQCRIADRDGSVHTQEER